MSAPPGEDLPPLSAIEWVAGVVDAFGFSHSEVMKMPFRTFLAYNKLAHVRSFNRKARETFEKHHT